jgi:FkbH-like protein
MKLSEALQINGGPASAEPAERVYLACGFTPLHLQTFLTAHVRQRLDRRAVQLEVGLFGDLPGNVERAARRDPGPAAVILEWSDIDPRLGLRASGGWGTSQIADILANASAQLKRLETAIAAAGKGTVAVAGPTLPLPPIGHTAGWQSAAVEEELHDLVACFHKRCAAIPGVRLVSRSRLDEASPAAGRLDVKMDLLAGFPYRQPHADALAALLTTVLYPPPPKKGLIVDLDNTLWSGIVGEIGATEVCWSLDKKAQVHGLFQQMVAALADAGVLVGVASKNDPAVAAEALRRSDMLVPESSLFPVEVNWGPKSASVGRILKAWNIGADAVIFVDDSPMELAEVQSAYPAMECLPFTAADPEQVWKLLWRLKDAFGKPDIREEDRLRSASLKAATALAEASEGSQVDPEFLAGLGATITFDYRKDASDQRALELINKTNQFNLNGRRYTESDWRSALEDPSSFLIRVSYEDKFGPLGKIAIVLGRASAKAVAIDAWVMSCRAFSRRIEHHTVDRLFSRFDADAVQLDYRKTDRNMPLQEFLDAVADGDAIPRNGFRERSAGLPHQVIEVDG